jgi:hypothetical protein
MERRWLVSCILSLSHSLSLARSLSLPPSPSLTCRGVKPSSVNCCTTSAGHFDFGRPWRRRKRRWWRRWRRRWWWSHAHTLIHTHINSNKPYIHLYTHTHTQAADFLTRPGAPPAHALPAAGGPADTGEGQPGVSRSAWVALLLLLGAPCQPAHPNI